MDAGRYGPRLCLPIHSFIKHLCTNCKIIKRPISQQRRFAVEHNCYRNPRFLEPDCRTCNDIIKFTFVLRLAYAVGRANLIQYANEVRGMTAFRRQGDTLLVRVGKGIFTSALKFLLFAWRLYLEGPPTPPR
jgi:hypothetical protein